MTLRNKSALPVHRIRVELTWTAPDGDGGKQARILFRNTLKPGEIQKQRARIPRVTDKKVARTLRARVVEARLVDGH